MIKLKTIKELKVAFILDEFSYQCFKYECNLIPITPENWKSVILTEKPDLLLVESAWHGNNGAWSGKLTHNIRDAVLLVEYCRTNNIPTVFWNKEDPYSFDLFISIAKWFDYIFTTDIQCINKYKEVVQHDHIYVLPFAAQPAIHNPIEVYNKREDKASYAGSYYAAKFPERQDDVEHIFLLMESYGLDIYDRYLGKNLAQFNFPEKYHKYIQGTLNGDEIIKAYKGYIYSINLNSIKNSLTMFARRVFELMASNTVVISSYSKGMKEMLGDLTICSDNCRELAEKIDRLKTDSLYYKKYRLLALREVLQYHTYQDRFGYVVEKALNIKRPDKLQSVAMIGFANNLEEIRLLSEKFSLQTYKNKVMHVLCMFDYEYIELDNIYIHCFKENKDKQLKAIIDSNYVGYFHKDDYYGENYLTDMMLVPIYTPCDGFGKATYYMYDGSINLCNEGNEYKFVNELQYRNAIINSENIMIKTLDQLYTLFNQGVINEGKLFSVDSFNYLHNGTLNSDNNYIKIISDLENIDKGKKIELIENQVLKGKSVNTFDDEIKLDLSKYMITKDKNIEMKTNECVNIHSELAANEHRYIYYIRPHSFEKIPDSTQFEINSDVEYLISSQGDKDNSMDISIVLVAYSKNKKENAYFLPLNAMKVLEFAPDIEKVIFAIRVKGEGNAKINEITIKKRQKHGVENSSSECLILTNIYPSYNNLYRNAFVHRRVKNYLAGHFEVDVFALNYHERKQLSQYEFDGVRVYTGYKEELRSLLRVGKYKKILVHFISPDMFEVLKEFLDQMRIIIWIHGSEAQPWHRRAFEYTEAADLSNIITSSNMKMDFIKELMYKTSKNLHFVFISDIFRKEVETDIGFKLESSRYSIIHNVIDSELFKYTEKTPQHRKKILSIGPFASKKYANDLKVKAILELAQRPFFNDLEFCIYGEGILFEETVEPIRKLKNVKIYEKFLTQNEIAEIHKEYGIFLTPTRWDSQGVSRDEAMASGLVPVTNRVAAIPEFVDDSCCMMAEEEDYIGLADAIEYLYSNPDEFMKKSSNAAERVKNQSGKANTIDKEIQLIKDF
jgi:glycosyltransferase involved in cell wall biosynthesis